MRCLVTRADDLGSSHGANAAIAEAAEGRFIRNISCMAVGPFIEEGAELVRRSSCCLGLHAVLNAEWDRVKWLPCAPKEKIQSLLTPSGDFPADPAWFLEHTPDLDEILYEFDRQLDRLTHLGLPIAYVDMHMMPYREIPGLEAEMSAWIARKGLIDHMGFYRTPAQFEPKAAADLQTASQNWAAWLDLLEDGQSFSVMHPCKMSDESLLMGNASVPAETVARHRDIEYRLLSSGILEQLCAEKNIQTCRYDQFI